MMVAKMREDWAVSSVLIASFSIEKKLLAVELNRFQARSCFCNIDGRCGPIKQTDTDTIRDSHRQGVGLNASYQKGRVLGSFNSAPWAWPNSIRDDPHKCPQPHWDMFSGGQNVIPNTRSKQRDDRLRLRNKLLWHMRMSLFMNWTASGIRTTILHMYVAAARFVQPKHRVGYPLGTLPSLCQCPVFWACVDLRPSGLSLVGLCNNIHFVLSQILMVRSLPDNWNSYSFGATQRDRMSGARISGLLEFTFLDAHIFPKQAS
ncbi:hypothetical protein PM082_000181 [Marasmius tenuissimus]|nr:hypothetical protein PM082_000181 [Marasmius tenuissimus]